MGGKGGPNEQKLRATQDQLRIARITQDVGVLEDDRAQMQKLVKKVMETTHCTTSEAEIALYDASNNVEEAVIALLEDGYDATNAWKEQKSRKAKRQEAEERAEELVNSHRNNRSYPSRNANNFSGSNRGRGSERGRGGYRGGARGVMRGGYGGRGGYQSSSVSHTTGGPSGANNVWDNSQAMKGDMSKEWTNTSASAVEEVPEDTEWDTRLKKAGTLVFEATPPVAPTLTTAASAVTAVTTSSSAPISFAAVAAAGAKARENASVTNSSSKKNHSATNSSSGTSGGTSATVASDHSSQSTANPAAQSSLDKYNSLYQNSRIVSTSSQLTSTAVAAPEKESNEPSNDDASSLTPVTSISSVLAAATVPVISLAPTPSVSAVTNTSAKWTTQLKNDLGIGAKGSSVTDAESDMHKPLVQPTGMHKPVVQSRPLPPMMSRQQPQHHHSAHTVEFVSGDSSGDSLPEYQFGFHLDSTSCSDDRSDDAYAGSKQRVSKLESQTETTAESSPSMLPNGTVVDFPSSISQQQQNKGVNTNGGVGITSSGAVHSSASGLRHSSSGLSYADTSSMSYPSSENRPSAVKPSPSLHQQQQLQQAQHPLYTTTQIPYNSYPYLNMYSPVTGVRQDEAQYAAAAALVQYPFAGMGQIDMSSLSTMLPPTALASQQQPSQPPPPVQSQHQQRPDQHASFVDPIKAYAAAVANSSAGGGAGSGLLGSQQQRDSSSVSSSTVAPPPGFSGPPSNLPTAAFTLPQHNHLSSLFQMPPTYHPQLNQLPFSFMLPNVTGNGQHKIGHQMFAQQTVEESLSDQRLSSQQPKVYGGGHQQMDKYGNSGAGKDRLGSGAQATPPPQMYQAQAPQAYLSQQMPLHNHNKKTYNAPQHWSGS